VELYFPFIKGPFDIFPRDIVKEVDKGLILYMVLWRDDFLESVFSTLQHYQGLMLLRDQVVKEPLTEVWRGLAEKEDTLEADLLECHSILALVVRGVRVAELRK
jgi:hypothetical protein